MWSKTLKAGFATEPNGAHDVVVTFSDGTKTWMVNGDGKTRQTNDKRVTVSETINGCTKGVRL